MPHSPTNSRSSPKRVSDALMEPFDRWLSTFTAQQLRPYGQIPETESFSRRNSMEVQAALSLSRVSLDIQINSQGLTARTEVIAMSFDPPEDVGGMQYQLAIPAWWWGSQRLSSEDIRAALRGEIEARLQGRPLVSKFMREYTLELRADLEDCARTLPASFYTPPPLVINGDPDSEEAFLSTPPRSITNNGWVVNWKRLTEPSPSLTFERPDAHIRLLVSPKSMATSSGVQDFVLIHISL